MERNTRSIIPPSQMNNKPRNAISPRDREVNSNYNHQPHYNSYNQQQNHHHQPQHHSNSYHHHPHPNSELINFVANAWKEKMASDKTEYFKPENTTEKVQIHFDLDAFLNAKMRNS